MDNSLLQTLPKIDVLLSSPALAAACDREGYDTVKDCARRVTEELRQEMLSGRRTRPVSPEEAAQQVLALLGQRRLCSLREVVNATGIVLHTNLGRAPLGPGAAEHVARVAAGYSTLEYDLARGQRGSRHDHLAAALRHITGAEDAITVNNNASAVFLMLHALAKGKKVAVSRGEMVEIGGSFRVPEIMALSGAELMEIGTTNKTHLRDYQQALDEGAEVLLKVHTSNYRIQGFTQSVSIEALSALAKRRGALVLYDMGSGFLLSGRELGMPEETHTARHALDSGADLVSFSGDKLLGSAQAGIILGRADLIERLKRNQFARVLRIDKLSLTALEYALQRLQSPDVAKREIPVLTMLTMTEEACMQRALALRQAIVARCAAVTAEAVSVEDEAGGGSLPGRVFPGAAVAVTVPGLSAAALEERLRAASTPVIARIQRERVLLSVRTLLPGDEDRITAALEAVQ